MTACTHLGRPKGPPTPGSTWPRCGPGWPSSPPGWRCSRTCASTRARRPTTRAFVDRLVDGFDAYVNDAFGASHRAHASIVGPPTRLPSAAGRLLAREVGTLGGLLVDPDRPFVAVVGGAKVGEKLGVLRALLERVDRLVVGGGMAFTFLAAQGHHVGASLLDAGRIDSCAKLLEEAGDRIVLPTDFVALGPGGTVGEGRAARQRRHPDGRGRHPPGLAGPRHRARERRRLRRRGRGGRDGVLERAHGGVRGRALRGRDRAPWPGRWPSPRASASWEEAIRCPPSTTWAWPNG